MPEIIQAPTEKIKFLIHRTRSEEGFAGVKGAIKEAGGVVRVLQGIDIRDWPAKDRRRADGGLYDFLADAGEGRTRASQELYTETVRAGRAESQWKTVPLVVLNITEGEMLLRHLAENTREDLPWMDKAELLRASVNTAGLTKVTRADLERLAKQHHLSVPHAAKLLRILGKANPKLMENIRALPVAHAESLTALPHSSQQIVVEALHQTGLHGSQTPAVVRMAQEQVHQTGKLSKSALVRDIERLKRVVKDQRGVLKLKRVHVAIGPQIYGEDLLRDKPLLAMLKEAGRADDVKRFMEEWKK